MCRVEILTLHILLIFSSVCTLVRCKSIKRNQKDLVGPTNNDLPSEGRILKATKGIVSPDVPPAILAIEIVNPDDNSTSKSKNTKKRTVNSNLGYGAAGNNHFGVSSKPQLVYYKYSQYDIPAYQQNSYYPTAKTPDINVHKSIGYDLGKQVQYNTPQNHLNQYYQPGSTLFTTFDQNGHFGQLSNQAPLQSGQQNIPVVYLKIYSNQLGNNALYSNLPQNHPYSGLNGVNLQSLLAQYFQTPNQQQNYQHDQGQEYYSNQPEVYQQNYQGQTGQYQYQFYQQPEQVTQNEEVQEDDLPTHENYPDDAHTRVIFHSNNGGYFPEKTYSKTNIPPARSYSSLEFKASQPDYSFNKETLPQEQDQDGYHYYKPQSDNIYVQDYQQAYQPQYTGSEQGSDQSTSAPYNYHAQPLRGKKRNVRRPDSLPKILTKIKQED